MQHLCYVLFRQLYTASRLKGCLLSFCLAIACADGVECQVPLQGNRDRISINEGWRFRRFADKADSLVYIPWPAVNDRNDNVVADTRASQSAQATQSSNMLKAWILPTANEFISDSAKRYMRPEGDPGKDFPFVQADFNDFSWDAVNLPHDWAIAGPFYAEANAIVGGGMGRLPIQGVGWYRRKINIISADAGKVIYLDVDGAMSYAMVWCNGHLVGGWPYGYNSFRLDLSPFLKPGGDNQLAIRLDNPPNSSRWYPGAGIYRNVWLTKVSQAHVAHWGSFIRTRNISKSSATIDLQLRVENKSAGQKTIDAVTEIYTLTGQEGRGGRIAVFPTQKLHMNGGETKQLDNTVSIKDPLLWGPPPAQRANRYIAVTRLYENGKAVDVYETRFGIRSLRFDPNKGVLINGKPVRIQGVNQHHDLGAIGAAFNMRAAERQLEILRQMGCNAIRFSHNPPAPELLDLTDRMGFLVIDEIYDCWEKGKTPLDFHLIFPEWQEADLRSFMRRDRNHPSIIEWSFGNEVGEQYTGAEGMAVAKRLYDIARSEDSSRPATASINYAKPDMPFTAVMDIMSLNYQGEGIRDAPAYSHLRGIRTSPLYGEFRKRFPGRMIQSSETASALSTRGTYLFPVTTEISAPVSDSTGGDPVHKWVSAYDLYTAAFGSSPDKVFNALDHHPFVAGEFVWTGWDYLGEPTPYYSARSSYSGIVDLAGFKKDRFYLYQSRWRPGFPMAHILPHWTWPGREGHLTPVHVYSSGDEAELFLNNKSLGRIRKGAFEYRFRWDSVIYHPGELKVITYRKGRPWATDIVETAGAAAVLKMNADRPQITADGKDLCFITLSITDSKGNAVPEADDLVRFSVEGPGEIVGIDNGDPADLTSFASKERKAFKGLVLVIVKSRQGGAGRIKIDAESGKLPHATVIIESRTITH